MEDLDTCLWIVEFNWKREQFHVQPLRSRLERNVAELLHNSEPTNPDWVTIGVGVGALAAHEYREAFLFRWRHRVRRESATDEKFP